MPLEQRELIEYFTLLTETRKHITFVDCPTEVDAVVRLCETLAGDLDRFRARPRISTVCTAASPLQVDGGLLDVHAALARIGVPIEVYSMTIAGATSPVTLAGTVVQGLAEFLGIATALQVAAPGARLIFCFGSGVLDMLRTTFALGSLESGLMAAMATEVGHHVGVPVLCPGLSTDAKHAGIQAGYEKAMKAATVCAAGPDIVTGWGLIDSHNTMSLPQSVIDNEMAGMLRRLNAPVEVSEATLGAAAVQAAAARAAASSARRTRRGASAPASTSCRRSPTACPTRSGPPRAATNMPTRASSSRPPSPDTRPGLPTSTATSWTNSRRSAASTKTPCGEPAAGAARRSPDEHPEEDP